MVGHALVGAGLRVPFGEGEAPRISTVCWPWHFSDSGDEEVAPLRCREPLRKRRGANPEPRLVGLRIREQLRILGIWIDGGGFTHYDLAAETKIAEPNLLFVLRASSRASRGCANCQVTSSYVVWAAAIYSLLVTDPIVLGKIKQRVWRPTLGVTPIPWRVCQI